MVQLQTHRISLDQQQKKTFQNLTDGDYHFKLFITAGPGVEITGPPFDREHGSNYGCGSGNLKCSCTYNDLGLAMEGYGTTGSATALDFWCSDVKFSIPGQDLESCTCRIGGALDYYGKGRRFDLTCNPRQCFSLSDNGKGTVWDLYNLFNNPNGDDRTPGWKDWEYNIKANPTGQLKPKSFPKIKGAWVPVASSAGIAFEESIHWDSTDEKVTSSDFEKSISAGAEFSFGSYASVKSDIQSSWKESLTSTFSKTNGGTEQINCNPFNCDGSLYQWQIDVTGLDNKWGGLFSSCLFACTENQAVPKCPFGTCCTNDKANSCQQCASEWCDPSDPKCPFADQKFVPGCPNK